MLGGGGGGNFSRGDWYLHKNSYKPCLHCKGEPLGLAVNEILRYRQKDRHTHTNTDPVTLL